MADTMYTPSDRADSAAGWAIAAVVVVAIIVGAVLFFQNGLPGVPNTGNDSGISVPTSSDMGSGSTDITQ